MKFTVAQIAELLTADIEGNKDAVLTTVCKIEDGKEGGISFLANSKYTHYIYDTKATAVIVKSDFVPEHSVPATLIKVTDPYLAFAQLLTAYENMKSKKSGISQFVAVAASATIGKEVYLGDFVSIGENVVVGDAVKIYPNVVIGDHVTIGNNTTLYAGVKVYEECVIGNNCIIHAGAVLGADGFGFVPTDGSYMKIPQIGNVVLEDGVEIGANTCIDRATMGSTIIRKNVKLDNLIQVGHNVEIGENTGCAAQVGISGSAKIGKNCILAGQVGVAGHITIGDHVTIGAQSGAINSLKDHQIVLGSPSIPLMEEKKLIIYRKKLPELYKKVDQLEKDLNTIAKE
ncbi:MAG: UDP-3-O-(3-hydroxymyristoyl)glucosamine N-acyltransferase [Bacteroidales bacterium]|jgi:UDP-3-O-[3-hydroxymyristoyl] glucosamine N-acyltransferase|nr:UDP-3-O-(3-hydroxymyristoyl)glucosamine N-acyltransferase [Bacteroidales bacterium]